MQILPQIEHFLRDAIGLKRDTISASGVMGAVRERMRDCGMVDETRYLRELYESPQEQEALIERIVIPETWFFRDEQPFNVMRDYVRNAWAARREQAAPIRVLSTPCSTGEEPYSIVMTLLDQGIPPEHWRVDACDISRAALAKAQAGRYSRHSFRSRDLAFRERFFRPDHEHFVLDEAVRKGVHFAQGNIIDPDFLQGQPCYDLIFFRNLMIYLGQEEQARALTTLDRLLCPAGLLFIGHAEPSPLLGRWFTPAGYSGAFAYRKRDPGQLAIPVQPLRRKPAPRPPLSRSPVASPPSPSRDAQTAPAPVTSRPPERTPDDRLAEAHGLADAGQLTAARRLCETLLQSGHHQAAVFYLLGLIHDAGGEAGAAETCFRKALYLEPDHLEALTHLALAAERRGATADASRYRERALRASRRQTGPGL